ncbi:MAG: hypothetical protein MK226_22140, partial [Saprospiraceae bacterium]|nr:hypothetical protein [Saprospiraceae bacterium]
KSYFSISAFFSRKSFTNVSPSYVQLYSYEIRFDHQTYSIDFNWNPFNNLYLGLGGTYSFFNSYEPEGIASGFNAKSEYGAVVGASYRYKGLVLNLKYLYGLNVKEPKEDTLIF